MTKLTVSAESNGKEYKIDFEIPKDLTQDEWSQLATLVKMACQQIGK